MRMICKLTEQDVGLEPSPQQSSKMRAAARAVVMNGLGQIALLYVSTDNYYKLPGGGVEPGESIEQALHREVLEEAGCSIEMLGEVGMIEELRNAWGIMQTSHCYLATVVGNCTEPSFTDQETMNGFELDWASPEDALQLIHDSVPQTYLGKFVQVRDQIFLQEAMEGIKQVSEPTDSM